MAPTSSPARRDVIIGTASILAIAILIFAGLGLVRANSDIVCTRVVQGPSECTQGSWSPWTTVSQTQDGNGDTVLTQQRTYTGVEEAEITLQYEESSQHGGGSCESGYNVTGQGYAGAGMATDAGGSDDYQATTEYSACQLTQTQVLTTSNGGGSESGTSATTEQTTGSAGSQTVAEGSISALDELGTVTSANGQTQSFGTESITISAKPELVQSGQTATINWQTSGMNVCAVTGSNGDAWNTLTGSEATSPITQQTIYKLVCVDPNGVTFNAKTTVSLAPSYQEQ